MTLPLHKRLAGPAWAALALLGALLGNGAFGASFLVSTPTEIASKMSKLAQPGDTLIMTNGLWPDVDILFKGDGMAGNPITLRAQTAGQVMLSGSSRLRISGSYLVVDGLMFTNGYRPSGDVIAFRTTSGAASFPASNSRLTNCAVIDYNPPDPTLDSKWVSLYGTSNRVENCYFKGKNNSGSTVVVVVDSQPDSPNYHYLARNFFGPRPPLALNGGETIRVGSSDTSLNLSRTVVENNYFLQCNGDTAMVANESCENEYRHNTFVECAGSLDLRYGNRCVVAGNYFLGHQQPGTGGVRIIGEDHRIYNNYFAELTGATTASPLCMMQGLLNSPLNGYFQVQRATVAFNTFVNCQNNLVIGLTATQSGTTNLTTLPPVDCAIANNLVLAGTGKLVDQRIDPINMLWEGNLMFGTTLGIPANSGILVTAPNLALAADGLWRPLAGSPALGGAQGFYNFVTEDIEGQPRPAAADIGCDQLSGAPVTHPPMTLVEVGPNFLPTRQTLLAWPPPADLAYGTPLGPAQLNATANVPGSFVYTPPAGTVLDLGDQQTLSVVFTPADALRFITATQSVTLRVKPAAPVLTWPVPGDLEYGIGLGAGQLNASANVPGIYTYTPQAGTVLEIGPAQSLTVVFAPSDPVHYLAATQTVSLNVIQATPVVIWSPPSTLAYGSPLGDAQLNAVVNVPGTKVYTPAAGTLLNAGFGQGLSLTFTPDDTVHYATVTRTMLIDVVSQTPLTPAINWAVPADVFYGTALGGTQFNATANVPGSFSYSPPAGTVLDSGHGQTLALIFTPRDTTNFSTVYRTVNLNVLPVTPVILWPTPADIPSGFPLGGLQLNASANVPGSLIYSPPAGTVLNLGTGQVLSVSFTPEDPLNYTSASQSVVLNVGKPVNIDMVRVAYLIPTNRVAQSNGVATLQNALLNYQAWFSDQMERNGFGPKTFAFETNSDQVTPAVHVVPLAETDVYLNGDATGARVIAAATAAGLPIGTPGQVWWVVAETHQELPDGSVAGGFDLGSSAGGSNDAPGWALMGGDFLALSRPDYLTNDTVYDGATLSDVGPYPLQQDVSFPWYNGETFSSVSSSVLGAGLRELGEALGLDHDFRNDENFNGSVMGYGYTGLRGSLVPSEYPYNYTRLPYGLALELNLNPYLNFGQPIRDKTAPSVVIATTGVIAPVNGLLTITFSAADAGGLYAALLSWRSGPDRELVDEMTLAGTSTGQTFATPYYDAGRTNFYTLTVIDLDGNATKATTAIFLPAGYNQAPFPSIQVTPVTAGLGEDVVFDASTSLDSQNDPSLMEVDWDAYGDGNFVASAIGSLLFTNRYSAVGNYLVRGRASDPAGATAISAPVAVKITLCPAVLSPVARTSGFGASTGTVRVTAGPQCQWTVLSTNDWITVVSNAAAMGKATVVYAVADNPSFSPRTGFLTIADQVFQVTQQGLTCTFSLSPTNRFQGFGVSTNTVKLTTRAECAWNVSNPASWITVVSNASGTGPATISYVLAANRAPTERTGVLTIGDQFYTVTQWGTNCTLLLSTTSQEFDGGQNTGVVTVATSGTCSWGVATTNDWINLVSAQGGLGVGVVSYILAPNPGPAARSGWLDFGQAGVLVSQSICSYQIAPASQTFDSPGGPGTVAVSAGDGCAWTTANTNDWITLLPGSPGAGSGNLAYIVAANPDGRPRSGVVLIAGQPFVVNQAGIACSFEIDPAEWNHGSGWDFGEINVTTGDLCSWTAVNTTSWITILSGASGTGGGTVAYLVDPNVGPARTASILIEGQEFIVEQAAGLRVAQVGDMEVGSGQTNCLPVVLLAQGSENSMSFSLCYDSNLLTFASAQLGTVPLGSTLSVNTNATAVGFVGFTVSLPPGWAMDAGTQTVATVCFRSALVGESPITSVRLCDQPAARVLLDVLGNQAPVLYQDGTVRIDGICTLGTAMDAPQLPWTTNGLTSWSCQRIVTYDGVAAAQSGAIPDGGTTSMQTTLGGPGVVSFWWKVSSEANNDTLRFSIGGAEQARISGEVDWQLVTFNVPAGNQVLLWSYVKNGSLSVGQDAGWVDQLQFAPAAPAITAQPADQSVVTGGTASFSVAAIAAPPLSYQWQKNGVNLVDGGGISGSSTANLTLSNVQPGQAGNYSVVLSNPEGAAISSSALLTVVLMVPLADALDTPGWTWTTSGTPAWVGQTGASHDGVDAAQSGAIGSSKTAAILTTLNGPGTLSFWWKVSSETNKDLLRLYLDGSEQLRISGEVDWQMQTFSVSSGSHSLEWRYSKNSSGTAGQDRGWVDQVQFAPAPPVLTSQPASQSVDAGTSVTFSATAVGAPPLIYQWFLNGQALTDGGSVQGSSTATLALSSAQVGQQGAYSVVVTSPAGTVTSTNAALVVSPVVPLAEALDRVNLTWTTSGTPPWSGQPLVTHDGVDAARSGAIGNGTTTSMQTSVNGPGTIGFWWKVSSETNSDTLRFAVAGTEQARISGEVDWQWRSFPVSSGSQTLKWTYSKSSSGVAGQDRAWVDQVLYVSNNVPTAPIIASPPVDQAAVANTSVTLSVGAMGSPTLGYQWQCNGTNLANGGNVSGATNANLILSNLQAAQAGLYSVAVVNPAGSIVSAGALLTVVAAPVITSQPSDQNVVAGATASFTVGALGMAPLRYQWQFNGVNLANGGAVSGATNATLKLTGAGGGQAGTYSVLVFNGAGTVLSAPASLGVSAPPAILSQPQAQTVVAGVNTLLNVAATGTDPLSYQWRLNGTNLAESAQAIGTTTPALSLSNIQPSQAGGYSVVVSNAVGALASSSAIITVLSPPAITLQPLSQSVAETATVTFSAGATGTAPLSFQWLRNGTPLSNGGTVSGATSSSLTLAGVKPADSGTYAVLVSNAARSLASSAAVLKVAAAPTLTDALDAAALAWTTSVAGPWTISTNFTHDGVDSAQSGAISANQTSWLQTTVSGPGTLRFWWKVSSETNRDLLLLSVDGMELGRISGEVDWQWQSFQLQGGSHDLRWVYSKDSFGTGGQDRGWLDQVEFTPTFGPSPPVIMSQPISQTVKPGVTVSFQAQASGTGPMSYQWRYNGADLADSANINGSTANTLTLLNVQAVQAGAYALVVRNEYSLAVSSNVLLTVVPPLSLAEALDTAFTNVVWIAGGYSPWAGQTSITYDGLDAARSGVLPDNQTNWIQTIISGPAAVGFWWKVSSQTNHDRLRFTINGVEMANISGEVGWRWRTFDLTNLTQVVRWSYTKDTNGAAGLDAGFLDQVHIGPAAPTVTRQPVPMFVDSGAMANFNVGASGTAPLNYQWQANGVMLQNDTNVSGAVLSRVAISNAQPAEAGSYSVLVANGGGRVYSTNAYLTVYPGQPMAQALDTPTNNSWNTGWTSGGDLPWFPQTSVTQDGVDAMQSGAITNSSRSWLETTITGPGKLSFWWKVSSQTNATLVSGDQYKFYIDGVQQLKIEGEVNWQLQIVTVTNGIHLLHWRYQKDNLLASGQDSAWLDQVQYAQVLPPQITNQPASLSVDPGTPVSFSVGVAGSPPYAYQWRFNGNALTNGTGISGATTPTLSLGAVQANQAGFYSVVVSNAAALVASTNALLKVAPSLPLPLALDAPTLVWTTTGTPPWLGQSLVSHDGVDAARNGLIGDGASSSIQATAVGPGSVTFWWKVSSETNGDFLQFSINGNQQAQISGEVDWQQATFNFGSGNQILKWTYSKNASLSVGQDRGWVDQVQIVAQPVAIVAQPSGANVDEGTTVNLTVTATGTPPLFYQWRRNGANLSDGGNLSGSATPKLTLSAAQAAQSGNYSVLVSNLAGGVLSSTVLLTVTPVVPLAVALDTPTLTWTTNGSPPWIGQPLVSHDGLSAARSGPVADGASDSMQTTVVGPGTLSFWWKVSSETNKDFLQFFIGGTQQAQISGEEDWQVRVFNIPSGNQVLKWTYLKSSSGSAGQDRGWVDQVQFGSIPPIFTTQPASATVDAGTATNLSIVVVGTPPLTYQWQLNGVNLADGPSLSGSTTATLSFPSAQPAQSGNYSVRVSNSAGTTNSSNALLTVVPLLPLADALDTPVLTWTTTGTPPWVGQPLVTHDGVDAARSGAVGDAKSGSMQTTITGPGTFSFWWKVSSETNKDYLQFFVGATQQGQISGEMDWRQVVVTLGSGSQVLKWTYLKNASGSAGQDRGWVDQAVFQPTSPTFTSQPGNLTVDSGTLTNFSVTVAGTPPFTYQWQLNGVSLSDSASLTGSATPILTFPSAQPAQSGVYSVLVSNSAGSVTSSNVTLTVVPVLPLAEALDAPTWTWTTTGTPPWVGQPLVTHDGVDAARSGAVADGASDSFQTTVTGPGTLSFWWKVSSETNKDFLQFFVGTTQQAQISGEVDWQQRIYNLTAGNQTLKWTYLKNASGSAGQDRGWVDQLQFGAIAPVIAVQPAALSMDAGTTTNLTVVAAGTPPFTYQWQLNGANLSDGSAVLGSTTATLTLSNAQPELAGIYTVVVSNQAGSVTSSNAIVAILPLVPLAEALDTPGWVWATTGSPPWVGQGVVAHDGVSAARSGSVTNGGSGSMQTTVNGPGTVSFWWKVSSETNNDTLRFLVGATEQARISGEVGWQLRSFNVPAGSQNLQWIYTKNGSVAGGQDRAWVDQVQFGVLAPAIATQPSSQTVGAGGTASFTVVAAGTPPFSYQWQFNGTNLLDGGGVTGSTTATLAWSNVQTSQNGTVTVVVNNTAGTATSSGALLTVLAVPPVVSLPDSLDTPTWSWRSSSTPVWTGQTLRSHDGQDAAWCGAVADGAISSMLTTITGPGTLSFWWKVSSETNNDLLTFFVGSTTAAQISGEVDWQQQIVTIPSGSQTLKWSYKKNASLAVGLDGAWVDQVVFPYTGAAPQPTNAVPGVLGTPASTVAASVTAAGTKVTLTWVADTSKTYQVFYKDNLADSDWTFVDSEVLMTWATVDGTVVTSSATARVEDILAGPTRFYQVVEY